MTVESATYISQLDSALPTGSDAKAEGDNHLRLVKAVLKAQFPNFGAAALSASNTQIDKVVTTITINGSASAGAVAVNATNDLGVGTASPVARAHVLKSSAATSPLTDQIIPAYTSGLLAQNATSADGIYCALSLQSSNAAGTGQAFSIVAQSTSTGFSPLLRFLARVGATSVERARIDEDGNLVHHINTAAPTLASNQQIVAALLSNTQLAFFVRGTDGVTRSASLTLS